MARQEPAGLGALPMTQKASPPVGNKKVKVEKMPKKGAAPKAPVDPRDEVMKLVAKKLKQDKTTVGIGSPTPGPTPTPMPTTTIPTPMTTALAAPTAPIMPNDPNNPTPMKEGGTKDKKDAKGLAVVIDMSSQPEYEKASEGTPNDPPPGATSSEVKDDQHVLLSEGELVVPANVVRYHGLGMYEGLRRDALTGLGEMENSGQVEYVSEEVKTAAAGMTILNNQPNVATMGGIKKQQGQYNPALGQYGTATAPAAASAKFVNTTGTFTDTNKDGIDDRLQPSVKPTGLAAPVATSAVTPAALNLGPTSNPNTVVGAGNIGSYVNNQSGIPGSGTTPVVEAPAAPITQQKRIIPQEDGGDSNDTPVDAFGSNANTLMSSEYTKATLDLAGHQIGMFDIGILSMAEKALGLGKGVDSKAIATAGYQAQQNTMKSLGYNSMEEITNLGHLDYIGEIMGANMHAAKNKTDVATGYKSFMEENSFGKYGEAPTSEQIEKNKEFASSIKDYINTNMPDTRGLAAPALNANTQVNALADAVLSNTTDASAGKLSPEITGTTNKTGPLSFGNTQSQDVMSKPGYQASYDKYSTQYSTSDSSRHAENIASLTTIANNAVTDTDKLAAQHVSQDLQMDRISSDAENRLTNERSFDVDETFGSGRNPDPDAMSAKEQREAQQKGVALGFAASTVAPGTSTNQALGEKGYSDTGAAPSGSQYSSTGTFSTESDNDTSSNDNPGYTSGNEIGTPTSSFTAEKTTGTDDDPDDDTGGGGGKIVCTEMYRQTQLDDWAQAMKTWHIYQKKYLTPIHEVGYHSLFKPFVRGMKVNKALTNLGAYLAKERTKHLRHILTKGKSADSIVGNIFCKIIHPIVYLVGLAVHKK